MTPSLKPMATGCWLLANRAAIYFLGYAALAGFCLPPPMPPEDFHSVRILDALMSVCLGIFAWGVVHLAEPPYYGRRWALAKTIAIPLVWLVLVGLLALLFRCLLVDYWMDELTL
jgi:hypothetical protein